MDRVEEAAVRFGWRKVIGGGHPALAFEIVKMDFSSHQVTDKYNDQVKSCLVASLGCSNGLCAISLI